MNTLSRRSGVLLDVARLDYELARRGATQRDLAKVAGVPEVTISRGRHGRHLRESTLRRLTTALLEMPVLAGAELLIRNEPVAVSGAARKKNRHGLDTVAITKEVSRVRGRTSRQA